MAGFFVAHNAKKTNLFLSVLYTLYTLQGIESNINVHDGFL